MQNIILSPKKSINVIKIYRRLIKDILILLGHGYKDTSLIILCLVVLVIDIQKLRWIGWIYYAWKCCQKS